MIKVKKGAYELELEKYMSLPRLRETRGSFWAGEEWAGQAACILGIVVLKYFTELTVSV